MTIRYTFLFLTLSLITSACFNRAPSAINEIKFDDQVDVIQVQNWHFLGSFPKDSFSRVGVMDFDFLNLETGTKEAEINLDDLLKVGSRNSTLKSGLIKTRPQGVNILDYVQKEEGVVYLFCEINNKTDEDVSFVFSGMQHAKLWLNNEPVYETLWKRVQYKYHEEYVPAKLKKGRNTLLLKLAYSDMESASHWKFNFFVSSMEHAKENYLTDYRFSILTKSIVDTNLTAYLGPFIHDDVGYRIFGNDSNVVAQGKLGQITKSTGMATVDLSSVERNGLYRIEFDIAGEKLEQDFYYGDFDTILHEISERYKTAMNSGLQEKDKMDLMASYERLQFLKTKDNDPELSTFVRAYWDRSRVLYAKELSSFFKKDGEERGANIHFDGLIKAYTSKIDGSKQYYSSYIPERLKQGKEKIPLILSCPFSYIPVPYLESWYTSNRDQDLWDSRLADEYGFGLVWLNIRGHPGLNDIAMTAFQEIMADLKTRYSIDEDRVFILGSSSSSRKALTLATRFPSLMAGNIFYGPDLDINKFDTDKYRIENLSNAYLFMQHSKNDEMVSVEIAERIFQRMKNYSRDPVLNIDENTTHFVAPTDWYRSAFEYLKGKKRNLRPDSITVSTSELKYGENHGLRILEKLGDGIAIVKVSFDKDTIWISSKNVNRFELDLRGRMNERTILLNGVLTNGIVKSDEKLYFNLNNKDSRFAFRKNNMVEGPINHAFANSFKVVFADRNRPIRDTLNVLWQNIYFNDMISVKEIDLSNEDIQNSNLVLIGTRFHNKTIQKIVEQLPIQIHEDHIVFREERINGNDILISFVYPNPLKPNRYIVLIASNSMIKSMPIRDFSNEGDSDFKIFRYRGDRYQLISSGDFDNDWR
ncbi:hypothetical protein [Albibacterium indicum]|uniref:hypothetical protein n=1 Tax=Albibacterium indicum TaxID=2292082 RepID=UPI000E4A0F3B|nr:hypothetical protein [Pedobacter indicus]